MTILYDIDGNEIEVPSDDEIKELKAKAESASSVSQQVSAIKEILGAKDDDNLVEAVKLAKESMNPNWPEARRKMDRLTEALKGLDPKIEVNDDGTINKPSEPMDITKITEVATKAAEQKLLSTEIDRQLQRFPEENREAVKKYFEKLTAGEELSYANIESNIGAAAKLVFPGDSQGDTRPVGGNPILTIPEGKDFSTTPQGENMAKEIFGDEAFSAKKE